MIVGNGQIAKAFKKRKNSYSKDVIFASGLANSQNKKDSEFKREINLLKKTLDKNKQKRMFYFSTLDVLRKKKSKYINHKKNIEKFLKKRENVTIIRLPQVISNSKNKFTIFNYLKINLKNNNGIKVYQNYYRNFIDVAEIPLLVNKIKKNNKTLNIINVFCNKSVKISYLVSLIIKRYKIKMINFDKDFARDDFYKNLKKFQKENYFRINKKNYLKNLLKKYL